MAKLDKTIRARVPEKMRADIRERMKLSGRNESDTIRTLIQGGLALTKYHTLLLRKLEWITGLPANDLYTLSANSMRTLVELLENTDQEDAVSQLPLPGEQEVT